jgi:hypothetical protein
MSQIPTASASSSRFQAMFEVALKAYQKQAKKDLLAHPLTSKFQSCDSTTAIIAILQDQVREFDRSHNGDERLTKWLGPTVKVISAFSAAVFGGVSLVSMNTCENTGFEAFSAVYFVGILASKHYIHRHWCLPFGKYLNFFGQIMLTLEIL